ncbi:MAG: chromate transporter [Clostridia bacterium]|nr:chromate transporter [Clostridia bacterium]
MKKQSGLLSLFISFFKIGLFSFGGGLSMLAIMEREFIEKRKWMEQDEFLDLVVIAESTPGPIAINAATYIGYKVSKFMGSIVSTIAICIPSFAIISIISLFFDAFLENQIVANAFRGIQACVIYLILSIGVKTFKKMKKTPLNIVIMLFSLLGIVAVSIFAWNFSSILFILIGAVLGLFSYAIALCKKRSNNKEEARK